MKHGVVLATFVAVLCSTQTISAQTGTTDDVEWETRSIRYEGGPVRPGAEVEGSLSVWTWIGGGAFIGGYAISLYGASIRGYSAIPFVGPWIAAFASENDRWGGVDTAFAIISGVLQPAGLVVMIYGLLNPSLRLVFDAPIGGPSPHETRFSVLPAASGADVGATLSVRWF